VGADAGARARTGRLPEALLADGGYVSTDGICGGAARDVPLYAPVPDGPLGR